MGQRLRLGLEMVKGLRECEGDYRGEGGAQGSGRDGADASLLFLDFANGAGKEKQYAESGLFQDFSSL